MNSKHYTYFLTQIEHMYHQDSGIGSLFETPLWKEIQSCFEQHIQAIETIIAIWYQVDNCYILEKLSWPHHRIEITEHTKFKENIESNISDMIPVVTFSLPNLPWDEELSDMRILRIEFWKAWLAWID